MTTRVNVGGPRFSPYNAGAKTYYLRVMVVAPAAPSGGVAPENEGFSTVAGRRPARWSILCQKMTGHASPP